MVLISELQRNQDQSEDTEKSYYGLFIRFRDLFNSNLNTDKDNE